MSHFPTVLVLLTILCTSVSQVLQKKAAIEMQRSLSARPLYANVSFLLSGMFLGASLICWLLVLKKLDVSLAYPLLSLNYVLVLILARWLFAERIPSRRWVGVASIIAGVAVLAASNH